VSRDKNAKVNLCKVILSYNSERQTSETFRESLQKIKVNFCINKSSPGVAKKLETTQRDKLRDKKLNNTDTPEHPERENCQSINF